MEAEKLNNLNTLPLNIACESVIAPSEEDNNAEKVEALEDGTDKNIDSKIRKPSEDKQNFRDLLQDRVLKRLQEKAEYGKRNISSPESTPPLKRYFSNEDLWKRVEGRVAAKKATLADKEAPKVEKVNNNDVNTNPDQALRSNSSEDIKNRIRSMSKAIGLASSIQNQIKSNDFKKDNPPPQHPKRSVSSTHAADYLNPNKNGLGLEQASSVYEETLSQGRFMEDDYFSLPSVGSTHSLFSNISEYRTFTHHRSDDALAKYLQCNSNILQDKDDEPQILTENMLLQYVSELTKVMKDVEPDPNFQFDEITPVGTPCTTPRSTTPTNETMLSRDLTTPTNEPMLSRDLTMLSRDLTTTLIDTSCQCEDHTPVLTPPSTKRESACQYSDEDVSDTSPSVTLSDANCQTSIVFQEPRSPKDNVSYSSRDTSTEDLDRSRDTHHHGNTRDTHHLDRSREEISVQCNDTDIICYQEKVSRRDQIVMDANISLDKLSDNNHQQTPLIADTSLYTDSNRNETQKTDYITAIADPCVPLRDTSDSAITNTSITKCLANDHHSSVSPIQIIVHSDNSSPIIVRSEGGSTKPFSEGGATKRFSPKNEPDSIIAAEDVVRTSAKRRILKNLADANLLFKGRDNLTPVSVRSSLYTPAERSLSSEAEVIEKEDCTMINIPCDGMAHSDGSNIQVMVNFWSQDDTESSLTTPSTLPCHHHHHHHHGVLTCNSIPQFEEAEVDALFQSLNYEDEEKRERMRRLLEDLDTEHFLNTIRKDLSDSDTSCDTSRDTVESRDQESRDTTPVNVLENDCQVFEDDSDSVKVVAPPDYFVDSLLPSDVYQPPEAIDCDDMSLPSVPSYFNDDETIGDDEQHFDDENLPNFDYKNLPKISDGNLPSLLAQPSFETASVDSCDTVILNNALQCDLFSKANQTLSLPFRLIKFLPVDDYCRQGRSEDQSVEVVVDGNSIAVQVDMSRDVSRDVSRGFETVRQELNWLDHETQHQARVIERHVMC